MDKQVFINKLVPGATRAYKEFNILPSITIAQAILESGWGKHAPGNNLFGIKWTSNCGYPSQLVWTTEYVKGRRIEIKDKFRVYNSYTDSIVDHTVLLSKGRYNKVREAKTYRVAAKELYNCGYATDPNYSNEIIRIIEGNNLQIYDTKSKNNCCKNNIIKDLQHELNLQFNAGLIEDGILGQRTLNNCCTVRFGAKGNITKIIQRILISKNYKINADGIFGEATLDSIKHFQKNKNILSDGIVGKNTWKYLLL